MPVSAPTRITGVSTPGTSDNLVDFFLKSDTLFSVMRDMISCEEVFEADPQAQAEFDAVCDEWQNEAIVEQDKDETDKAVDRQ
mgnify:CR=1 FL=1